MSWPEDDGHPHPVAVAFSLGADLFALEQTGIVPFKGHVRMEAEAERHLEPITEALKNALGTSAVFELHMPANAFQGRRMGEIRALRTALLPSAMPCVARLRRHQFNTTTSMG
jgi:hypothetical protein